MKPVSIYFDLDGVLRNLAGEALGEEPTEWDCKKDGVHLLDIIDSNRQLLVMAKPLPYIEVYRWCITLGVSTKVLSAQVRDWIPITNEWIEKHLGKDSKVIFVRKPEDKLNYIDNNSILIDDYPFFKEKKSNIIIVDHPYNRSATGFSRVFNADELKKELISRISN